MTYGELKKKYNNFKGWEVTRIPIWNGRPGIPFTLESTLNDNSNIVKVEEEKNKKSVVFSMAKLKYDKEGNLVGKTKVSNMLNIYWEVK